MRMQSLQGSSQWSDGNGWVGARGGSDTKVMWKEYLLLRFRFRSESKSWNAILRRPNPNSSAHWRNKIWSCDVLISILLYVIVMQCEIRSKCPNIIYNEFWITQYNTVLLNCYINLSCEPPAKNNWRNDWSTSQKYQIWHILQCWRKVRIFERTFSKKSRGSCMLSVNAPTKLNRRQNTTVSLPMSDG